LRARVSGLARPLRQSRAEGVAQRRALPVRSAVRRLPPLGFSPSEARGVGQRRNISVRLAPLDRRPEQDLGVGQAEHEQAFAPVGRADARSREESFRNPVTQALQLASDLAITEVEMVGDVLQENKSGLAFADDAGDMGPEVAGVGCAAPLAGDAKWLTRVARQ
jgi:hypothetical protein